MEGFVEELTRQEAAVLLFDVSKHSSARAIHFKALKDTRSLNEANDKL